MVAALNAGHASADAVTRDDLLFVARNKKWHDSAASTLSGEGLLTMEQNNIRLWWWHHQPPNLHPAQSAKAWLAIANFHAQHHPAISRQLALLTTRAGGVDSEFSEHYWPSARANRPTRATHRLAPPTPN